MIDILQIESFYPESMRVFKKNILREYLQYKILEIIFDSDFGNQLVFMGGTAVRILHQNTRFSEDLDFDNRGINQEEFNKLIALIQKKLKLEDYTIEIKNIFKKAYHSYIKFSGILFKTGISSHLEEKLLIQIDTESQDFPYKPEKIILNKFDVFLRINAVPLNILLAQKITAIFTRKRAMGRDFYDAVFLLGKTMPEFDYLNAKLRINSLNQLKKALLLKCKELNFKQLAKDVKPFLFRAEDSKKIIFFEDYLQSL